MAILNCRNSLVNPQILASSALPNDSSSPSISPNPRPHLKPTQLPPRKLQVKLSQAQPGRQQPSVLEIERAIGSGIFRDRDDVNSDTGDDTRNSVRNGGEGSVDKKLRDTGTWLIDQTERYSRSAGKQILMAMFVWMIPVWMLGFLVASGIIQLPFQTSFLDLLY